jgi:hypothetical protein
LDLTLDALEGAERKRSDVVFFHKRITGEFFTEQVVTFGEPEPER